MPSWSSCGVPVRFGPRGEPRVAEGVVDGTRWSVRFDGAELEIVIERPATPWRRFRVHASPDVVAAAIGGAVATSALLAGSWGAAAAASALGVVFGVAHRARLQSRRVALTGRERVTADGSRVRVDRGAAHVQAEHRDVVAILSVPGPPAWTWLVLPVRDAWRQAERRGLAGRLSVETGADRFALGAWLPDETGRAIVAAVAEVTAAPVPVASPG